jgi:hypothetical protein
LSDNANYEVALTDGEAALKLPDEVAIVFVATGEFNIALT